MITEIWAQDEDTFLDPILCVCVGGGGGASEAPSGFSMCHYEMAGDSVLELPDF